MTSTSKRLREEAARWFTRMQNASPDHPDRGRFEAWLMANPAHASEYAAFAELWEDFDSTSRLKSLAQALERKTELSSQKIKTVTRGILSLLLIISCGLFGQRIWQEWMDQPISIQASSTGVGEIKKQELADGSQIILNADTTVDVVYYHNRRVATLKRGEVIFDVSKDPDRPFIVDSGLARVTVLGTNFAVNRLSQLVRVSVNHGRVQVQAQDAEGKTISQPWILSDGQVAEVDATHQVTRVQRSAQDAFSFQSGTINFQQATIDEIAETLSRYRKSAIKSLVTKKSIHVTAVVQASDIESFLLTLPRIAPVNVEESGGETRLMPRK